jgi:hypothetical protein
MNLYCPEAYHRPDHSIRTFEYHRKIIIIIPKHTSSPRLEPRTVFGFVTLVPVVAAPKQTILFFALFLYPVDTYQSLLHSFSSELHVSAQCGHHQVRAHVQSHRTGIIINIEFSRCCPN